MRAAETSRTALTAGTVVITDVDLIPMTSDSVIRDATVLILARAASTLTAMRRLGFA